MAGTGNDRGTWGSRMGFILAAAGSAVGLGNLWKFPYLTYKFGGGESDQHGAGTFVFLYLLCVLLVGLPVMIAEILIGRRGKRNPVGSFEAIRPGTPWKAIGYIGLATGFVILSYYAVVAGWAVEYVVKSVTYEYAEYDSHVTDSQVEDRVWQESIEATGKADLARDEALAGWRASFADADALAEAVREKKLEAYPVALFHDFLASPWKQVGYFLVFMTLTLLVVLGGVAKGIERWNRILMPLLLVMLAILAVRVLTLPGGIKAVGFLFKPRLSDISFEMLLWALGQAFFSLSLGMGALLTYGSYLRKQDRIATCAGAIVGLDALVALMASVIIFGSIFSYGLVMKGSGVGNLFTAIPVIFQHMPGGRWLVVVFYLLIAFAALTSTVSLLEVVSSYLIDEKGLKRPAAVGLAAGVISLVGIPCALSFNVMSDVTLFGKTFFDLFDFIAANIALPAGGIGIAIFVGWVLTRQEKREELPEIPAPIFTAWNLLVRFLAPVAIAVVLVALLMGRVSG
jgi:NSS family neurotransmitter:Na+ symporter